MSSWVAQVPSCVRCGAAATWSAGVASVAFSTSVSRRARSGRSSFSGATWYSPDGGYERRKFAKYMDDGKLDKQTVISLLELRIAIEGQAVRRFAERHTENDIAFLRKQLDTIEAVAQARGMANRHELAQMIFNWHHAICLRSGNDILPLVLNAFQDVSVFFWETSLQIYGLERSMGHLETILSLLTERKGEEVVQYMSEGTDYYITHM